MPKLMPIWMIGLALSLVLAACAPAPSAPAALPASPQPTPLPAATPLPTDEPLAVAVPAILYSNAGSTLVVVSSITGKVFDAFAPIPLSDTYNYAFSPDGRTLAMVSARQLDLIDLRSWKYRSYAIDLYGWFSAVVYSPDGERIAIATGGPGSDIRIVDAGSGKIMARTTVDFSVRSLRFTTDQKAVMVYGPQVDWNGISTGAPMAASFAASDLSTLWTVELKSVRDGAFPKNPRTPDIHQPGAAWNYAPAIAFAPNDDILYVVHGDEDKLTTVDFNARRARTVAIHAKLSWLDRLMALTAGVAYAKGMDGTTKQGVISPDGKYLYVIATTEAYVKNSTGNWDVTVTHGGLQVIAAQDGTILRQQNTEASSLAISPDGKYLLLTGWKNNNYSAAWSEVYDAASNAVLKHMDSIQLMPTRLLDGNPDFVSTNYSSDSLCQLASIDPTTWKITGNWKGDCIGWLIDP